MRYYSFAGEARGIANPEDVFCTHVSGDGCDVAGCVKDNCDHTVIMWSGNGYSKKHTWIAAEDDYVIDLDKSR